jgi:hypothetical protein
LLLKHEITETACDSGTEEQEKSSAFGAHPHVEQEASGKTEASEEIPSGNRPARVNPRRARGRFGVEKNNPFERTETRPGGISRSGETHAMNKITGAAKIDSRKIGTTTAGSKTQDQILLRKGSTHEPKKNRCGHEIHRRTGSLDL